MTYHRMDRSAFLASMRPPEFTGGNSASPCPPPHPKCRFNEAAGIHRRKREENLTKYRETMLQ